MSIHGEETVNRMRNRSEIRGTMSQRRLPRDRLGMEIQEKYISLCNTSRPAVKPNKDILKALFGLTLVWDLSVAEKRETAIIASLLLSSEARNEISCVVITAGGFGCSSVRMKARAGMGSRNRGVRELAEDNDPTGEVELFHALCKALPHLDALRTIELDGLRRAFQQRFSPLGATDQKHLVELLWSTLAPKLTTSTQYGRPTYVLRIGNNPTDALPSTPPTIEKQRAIYLTALRLLQTVYLRQLSGKQRFGRHEAGFTSRFHRWSVHGCAFSFLFLTVSATAILSKSQYETCTEILTTIADAVCDLENNIESCEYDGGDCCPSTCVSTEDEDCATDTRECMDPDASDYPYAEFENCDGSLRYINDGICDTINNNIECGYDGGDCCPSTCSSSAFCPEDQSECIDPDAEDFGFPGYETCTGYMPDAGNGKCSDENNNAECGYDLGDCCECTCVPDVFSCVAGFDCVDPSADNDDECGQVESCSMDTVQQLVVRSTADAMELARSIECSGGLFNVEWKEHVVVNETIWVTHNTTLNITGSGGDSIAIADGNYSARIFAVVNASLYLENMQLARGLAPTAGALFIDEGNVTFSGEVLFINNTSTMYGGGAIRIISGGNLSSNGNLTFAHNDGAWHGGAINVESSSVSLSGTVVFVGNKLVTLGDVDGNSFGGAVYASDNSRVYLSGQTVFLDNMVTGESIDRSVICYGGAVAADSGSLISWTGRTFFVGNNATSGGGALYANSTAAYEWTAEVNFSNNLGDNGGAVLLEGASTASWSGATTFEGNEADIGGVFYIVDGSTVRWTANTTLFGNKATSYGGGVYVRDSSVLECNGPTQIENNTASEGGGLYIGDGPSVALNSSAIFANNVAGSQGGAIYAVANPITTGDTEVHFNAPTKFFNNYGGTYGGALMVSGSITLELDSPDIEFESNRAKTTGGAVLLTGVGTGPTFRGSKFIENEAEIGGAVYATGTGTAISATGESSPLIFDTCNFTGNIATSSGGAMESAAGNDYFVNTSFVENVATQGGALRLAGTVSIIDCHFERNTAAEDGGPAISNAGYIEDISSSYFADNDFNCDGGYFLHFHEGDRYGIVCSGCSDCDDCTLRDNYSYPICLEELEHTNSTGGSVVLETLNISEGYWRATPGSWHVLECYNEDACLGGLTNSSGFCATGYEGPYCAVCSYGYADSLSHTCHNCSDDKAVLVAWLVVPLVLLLGLMFVGNMVSKKHHTTNHDRLKCFKKLPLQSIKIVVVAWQILIELTSVANISFPTTYEMFLDGADLLNFDVGWILSAGCFIDMDFHDRLIACTMGPLGAMGVLAFTYKIALHRNRGCEEAIQEVREKHVSIALWITFLVYSSMSSTVFQMFSCELLDDGNSYLRADYNILCHSSKHRILQVYAAFMILVYSVGIPLGYAALLYVGRDALKISPAPDTNKLCIKATIQLSSPYRPGCFYYEVVECTRRVTLTGAIVFVLPYEMGQVAVILILVMIFALCSESLAPYRNPWDTWISRIGHVVVFLSIFVAFLVLYVEDDEEGSASEEVYGSALVATNICWIVAVVVEGLVTACSFGPVAEHLPRPISSAVADFSGDHFMVEQKHDDYTDVEVANDAHFLEDSNHAVGSPRLGPSKSFPFLTHQKSVAPFDSSPKVS